jgi:hypothetical protein
MASQLGKDNSEKKTEFNGTACGHESNHLKLGGGLFSMQEF